MESLTDQQLLRDYAEHSSESAFAELVRRHIDFVYSAALRMVCDAHLAQDVTQTVFVALAKNAPCLMGHPVLSGWLHRAAQNIAAQTVRTEVRRRTREQEAATMNQLLSGEAETAWENLAPHLDAALGELNESERDAVLLRYFERKSAREMAQILGVADAAAQKRVNRGVERLRQLLAKRGVTVGAGGLVVVISANAVQAAPAGLAATICSTLSAGTAVHTATALVAAKLIALTTFQKTALATLLAAALGTGIYQARQVSNLRGEVRSLRQQQTTLAARIQQVQRERDDATNRLAAAEHENKRLKSDQLIADLLKLRGEAARWRNAATDPEATAIKASLARVDQLKQRLEQTPEAKIPELQFLTEKDWFEEAKGNPTTPDDYRRAFGGLRRRAQQAFAPRLQAAWRGYLQSSRGQFPTNLAQVQPFFHPPVDPAMLQGWQIVPGEDYGMPSQWVVTQKAAVDEDYDMCAFLTPGGNRWTDFKSAKAMSK